MFELLLTKTFAVELKKLEKKDRERIKTKLRKNLEYPWANFQRLTGQNLFRTRVGKFRVIAQISGREKKITLFSVKHRKKAYQKL